MGHKMFKDKFKEEVFELYTDKEYDDFKVFTAKVIGILERHDKTKEDIYIAAYEMGLIEGQAS